MSKKIYKILAFYIIFSSIPLGLLLLYAIFKDAPWFLATVFEKNFVDGLLYVLQAIPVICFFCLPFCMQIAAGIGILKEKPWTRDVLTVFPFISMFVIPLILFFAAFGKRAAEDKFPIILIYGIFFIFISHFFLFIWLNFMFSIATRRVKDRSLDFKRAVVFQLWSLVKKILIFIALLIIVFIGLAFFVMRS